MAQCRDQFGAAPAQVLACGLEVDARLGQLAAAVAELLLARLQLGARAGQLVPPVLQRRPLRGEVVALGQRGRQLGRQGVPLRCGGLPLARQRGFGRAQLRQLGEQRLA